MNNVRTLSDTKRAFYTYHTRPINSIYRRVVEEIMVEMHLLSVNVDFRYDPIYGLGVVSAYEQFMQGYAPEADKVSIFKAICQSIEDDPQRYQEDARRLEELVQTLSEADLIASLSQPDNLATPQLLREIVSAIAHNPKFKYSRLFAIGLYSLLEKANAAGLQDEKQRNDTLKQVSTALHLPEEKLQKDLELYRSNLEKMAQARIVMEDALQAERKKREQREQQRAAANSPSETPPSES
ncbi:MAG: photosystem II biogenesis protein Psp29 [Desertifilum sp.]|nr:photosystem II biogenesis protein Psp29 [Desertifilum sp.]